MIDIDRSGTAVTLTINRPERRNALNNAMYGALADALVAAQEDAACTSVILTGAAGHFTAGNDIEEFQQARGAEDSPALRFLRTLAGLDVPVIAAVEGTAVGVGVTLLQHCDFVFASGTARFSMPFVALGLCPEGGSSLLLAQLVGPRRAAEWLLLGKGFTAEEAQEAGFITAAVAAGAALDAARAAALSLAAQPANALRVSKRLIRQPLRDSLSSTFDRERDAFRERLQSTEAKVAFERFLSRRKS
ncbi:MAG TPA: enoyl-CoA hydratase-related protein [Burkholderiaceae bacterium]|nr:enoyl-CoA hydratase-related protein [Burkholderiaceae bacterium]